MTWWQWVQWRWFGRQFVMLETHESGVRVVAARDTPLGQRVVCLGGVNIALEADGTAKGRWYDQGWHVARSWRPLTPEPPRPKPPRLTAAEIEALSLEALEKRLQLEP